MTAAISSIGDDCLYCDAATMVDTEGWDVDQRKADFRRDRHGGERDKDEPAGALSATRRHRMDVNQIGAGTAG